MTVLTYLWGKDYRPEHVRRLVASVSRWLSLPHRFVCVTDQKVDGVETLADPARVYTRKCYRRLWLFSEKAKSLGPRILHLDLDIVVCGQLDALVTRPAPFTIYRAGSIAKRGYSLNPSVFVLDTGTQTDIWERFIRHPERLGAQANADGFWGSDQAVISYLRRDTDVDTVADADGVVSFRRIRSEQLTAPPDGTRIVSFHGRRTPWEREVQAAHPWIQTAWREVA